MDFDLDEKLAIVKMIDSVIQVDGEVHQGEIEELNFLMNGLDFDAKFIFQAQKIPYAQSMAVLETMSEDKKIVLGEILVEMANADGFIHLKEMSLIIEICTAIGITVDID